MNEMTLTDFLEQMVAFERRLNERFDLLERLMALGFDDTSDTSDQIKIAIERLASSRESTAPAPAPARRGDVRAHG